MGPKNNILWLLCGGAALAIHAGAAALLFGNPSDLSEVSPAGQKGVLVELSFEGAAAGGLSRAGNINEKTEAPTEPAEQTPPKKTEPTALTEEEKKKTEQPPQQPPMPMPEKKVAQRVVEQLEPVLALSDQENVSAVNEVGSQDGAEVKAVTNSVRGAGGPNAAATGKEGEGNATQSGGAGGVIKSYEELVQLWVHKHILYPKSARRRQLTGTVLVRFKLDTKGALLSAEIAQDSAYRILNKSALKTLRRATPFPAFPAELKERDRVFLIPIEYKAG